MKRSILVRMSLFCASAIIGCNVVMLQAAEAKVASVSGTLQQWHDVKLSFEGPLTSETSTPNPFTDYRVDVTFTHADSGVNLVVPGYFATDGNAGHSHATKGNVWRAHLLPVHTGTWKYEVSFRQGPDVATADGDAPGESAGYFDGASGTFEIKASDKTGADFRAAQRGLLKNRGSHYFTFANGKPWLVAGVNIPETIFGFKGFDNTPNAFHSFENHIQDWNSDNPDWDSLDWDGANNGRALVGAINYIAKTGGNSFYFVAMNVGGDGDATYPTIAPQEKMRYDISKMDQWAMVLDHANAIGVYPHVILGETERKNEQYHDKGQLGPQRKLYYRMLSARFGHLPAMAWGIGEESDFGDERNLAFARYLRSVDPYHHPTSVECRGNKYHQQYDGLLGEECYDSAALQGGPKRQYMAKVIQEWRELSAKSGVPWVAHYQEPQGIQNDKSDLKKGYNLGRRDMMWPAFMSGSGGFEWYVQEDGGITGKKDPKTGKLVGHRLDHQMNDFRDMDQALIWSGHAVRFFERLPLMDMRANHERVHGPDKSVTYALEKQGKVYAVYNDRHGRDLKLDLTGVEGNFQVRWYDPRNGGELQSGSVETVSGGKTVVLGNAPRDVDLDWAVLVERR